MAAKDTINENLPRIRACWPRDGHPQFLTGLNKSSPTRTGCGMLLFQIQRASRSLVEKHQGVAKMTFGNLRISYR